MLAVPDIALPVYAASLTRIMVTALTVGHDLSRPLDDVRYTGFLVGPGAGVTVSNLVLHLSAAVKWSRDDACHGIK